MFEFLKRKIKYDPSPKIITQGTVYVTMIELSIHDKKTLKNKFAGQQILFSGNPIKYEIIMKQQCVIDFITNNQELGIIETKEFECELKTVREKLLRPAQTHFLPD